jgi:hypothetical protein
VDLLQVTRELALRVYAPGTPERARHESALAVVNRILSLAGDEAPPVTQAS